MSQLANLVSSPNLSVTAQQAPASIAQVDPKQLKLEQKLPEGQVLFEDLMAQALEQEAELSADLDTATVQDVAAQIAVDDGTPLPLGPTVAAVPVVAPHMLLAKSASTVGEEPASVLRPTAEEIVSKLNMAAMQAKGQPKLDPGQTQTPEQIVLKGESLPSSNGAPIQFSPAMIAPEADDALEINLPERQIETSVRPSVATGSPGFGAQPPTSSTPPVSISMQEPVGGARWNNELANRVTVMVNNGQHSARIELNPPSLGPMDVQVKIVDDSAEINFVVQHSVTRDMVEAASQRLREAMLENGFASVDVNVSDERSQDAKSQHPQEELAGGSTAEENSGQSRVTGMFASRQGLIDEFA